jgi:hypothetical protein
MLILATGVAVGIVGDGDDAFGDGVRVFVTDVEVGILVVLIRVGVGDFFLVGIAVVIGLAVGA